MWSINGIGAIYYGYYQRCPDGSRWATLWITFLYLPLVPLHRKRLLRIGVGRDVIVQPFEKSPLRLAEILKTYLLGWLVLSVITFGPGVFAVIEVWQAVGLQALTQRWFGPEGGETAYNIYIGFAIVWLVLCAWRLRVWLDNVAVIEQENPAPAS